MKQIHDAIRTVIVSDDPLAQERLCRLLMQESGVEVVGRFADGPSAVSAILAQRPQLVLIDVRMRGVKGFEVLDAVGIDRMPTFMFVREIDQRAIRAFAVRAIAYPVEPLGDQWLDGLLERIGIRQHDEQLSEPPADTFRTATDTPFSTAERSSTDVIATDRPILVRTGQRLKLVKQDLVDWVEADGVYGRVHAGRATHLVRMSLNELERHLNPLRFVRIHRSTIVNLDRISELRNEGRRGYAVLLQDGVQLRLSRSRKSNLERLVGQHL